MSDVNVFLRPEDEIPSSTDSIRDLGVVTDADLRWMLHCFAFVENPSKTANFILLSLQHRYTEYYQNPFAASSHFSMQNPPHGPLIWFPISCFLRTFNNASLILHFAKFRAAGKLRYQLKTFNLWNIPPSNLSWFFVIKVVREFFDAAILEMLQSALLRCQLLYHFQRAKSATPQTVPSCTVSIFVLWEHRTWFLPMSLMQPILIFENAVESFCVPHWFCSSVLNPSCLMPVC